MTAEPDAFVAEFKRWRDVRGFSQTSLAKRMGYDRSYISKIENAHERPTPDFAERADEILQAGGAIRRAFHELGGHRGKEHAALPRLQQDPQAEAGNLVVEHDDAELRYDGAVFNAIQRRKLFNGGTTPITRYLIRISVDRYPGDPERSNRLYREHPLTWEELGLSAWCDGEEMAWRVAHDWDAFKEVWLLFENPHGRFPLYPGESTWIEYDYTVSDTKWGPWYQRAVRLPTKKLSVSLVFPAALDPVVWRLCGA